MFVKGGQDKRRKGQEEEGVGRVRGAGCGVVEEGREEEKNNICLKTKNHNRGVKPTKDERSKMEIPKKIVYMEGTG